MVSDQPIPFLKTSKYLKDQNNCGPFHVDKPLDYKPQYVLELTLKKKTKWAFGAGMSSVVYLIEPSGPTLRDVVIAFL